MCPGLEPYIRRYYNDWLGCSRRWCSMNGIPQEAYDLLADVLESLCRKSDALLSDMLSHENNGDKKLFYYVRKTLRYTILKYRFHKYQPCNTLDLLSDVQHSECKTEIPDELFDTFRINEAKLRADDFIDPGLEYDGVGRLTRYVTRLKTNYGYRLTARYVATAKNGHCRQFARRTSAITFLADQNSPPPKNRRAVHVKLRLLQINIA